MPKLSQFGRDTGLQVRMATVMLLLGAVYVVFVGALLTAGVGAGIVIVIAGGLALLQLHTGQVAEALASATAAVDQLAWWDHLVARNASRAILASAATMLGDARTAAAALDGIDRSGSPTIATELQAAEAEARAAVRRGDPAPAAPLARAVAMAIPVGRSGNVTTPSAGIRLP